MPRKDHWDAVYTTKANDEVSWFEADPTLSLNLIQQVSPTPNSVIDVGGGQSLLVDRLLDNRSWRVAYAAFFPMGCHEGHLFAFQ